VWKTKDDNGKAINVVVEGGRRLRAIGELVKTKKAGDLKGKVPVLLIAAKTLQEARVVALVGNIHRENLTSYEQAVGIQVLKEEGMEQKSIASKLNKSPTWVSRQLSALRKSTELVQRAWKMGRISDDAVQDLVKLPHPEQDKRLQEILDQLENGKDANGKTTREAKAAARKTAKGDESGEESDEPKEIKAARPSADKLARYIEMCGKAKKKDRYLQGMLHAFKFMNGDLGPGEFDKEWIEFAKKQGMYKTDAPKNGVSKSK
jgi:ParB/RepB/Spo0J family partition protein